MFKKKLTLSELIDQKEKQAKIEEIKEQTEYNILDNKITSLVSCQFEKAEKILGYRFTMNKEHSKMFYFYFQTDNNSHSSTYIHSKEDLNEDMIFEFTPYYPSENIRKKLRYLNGKEIKINDLAEILIKWVQIIVGDINE